MEFLKGFFKEGTLESMTRLATFMVVINCVGLSWYSATTGKSLDTLILSQLALILIGKVSQKQMETK